MKALVCLLAVALTVCCFSQQPAVSGPPAEMKMVDFMVGDWVNKDTLGDAGKKFDATFKMSITKALGGRYLLVRHSHNNAPGEPDTEGLHMLTYDPDKKVWRAWWFISTENGATELSGNFEGEKLVMISDVFHMDGVTGDLKWRATWQGPAKDKLSFKLELNQGGSWDTFFDRIYIRRR